MSSWSPSTWSPSAIQVSRSMCVCCPWINEEAKRGMHILNWSLKTVEKNWNTEGRTDWCSVHTFWKSDRLLLQPSLGCIRRLLKGSRLKCQKYYQLTQNKVYLANSVGETGTNTQPIWIKSDIAEKKLHKNVLYHLNITFSYKCIFPPMF